MEIIGSNSGQKPGWRRAWSINRRPCQSLCSFQVRPCARIYLVAQSIIRHCRQLWSGKI
ncbi:hypothetical protein RSAG8_07840, partial [Rhizoctonia solani AG-8 WAC10335]